jgi:hypothetical protein
MEPVVLLQMNVLPVFALTEFAVIRLVPAAPARDAIAIPALAMALADM